jgi:hypothetical protein
VQPAPTSALALATVHDSAEGGCDSLHWHQNKKAEDGHRGLGVRPQLLHQVNAARERRTGRTNSDSALLLNHSIGAGQQLGATPRPPVTFQHILILMPMGVCHAPRRQRSNL